MASEVCSNEAEQEFVADAYGQAEKHILDARADLWEASEGAISDSAAREVERILSVLLDAAVAVRLLRSNVDGLLDGVLPTIAETNADEMIE
jgi:hypothetical protein